MPRTQVFVSYSHADSDHLQRLKVHLRPYERESLLDFWADTKIRTGQRWKEEIRRALDQAAVAILLVSADFLASDFIVENELPPLLEAAERDGVKILPVILKPCAFEDVSSIAGFQAVNDPRRPLIGMTEADREEVWVRLAREVQSTVLELRMKPMPETSTEGTGTAMFGDFGWSSDLLSEEIKNPERVNQFHVYRYEHVDLLEYMPAAKTVLAGVKNADAVLIAVKSKLRAHGWEGDGELQILWIPPFVGAGAEDTWGVGVWFVKQGNNGTAFLASPVPLPFSRLLWQNP